MLKLVSILTTALLTAVAFGAIGDYLDNFGPHPSVQKSGAFQNVPVQPDMGYYAFSFGAPNTYAYQSFTFKLRFSAFLTVVDCYFPDDTFQAFDNGIPVALTQIQTLSVDPIADYSNDVWYCQTQSVFHSKASVFLNPGHHNITIAVINSEFGGGTGFIRVDKACQISPYITDDNYHTIDDCDVSPPCTDCPQVQLSEPQPCCFLNADGLIDPAGPLCNQMVNYPKC